MTKIALHGICTDCERREACAEDHPPTGRTRTINDLGDVTWCSRYYLYDPDMDSWDPGDYFGIQELGDAIEQKLDPYGGHPRG